MANKKVIFTGESPTIEWEDNSYVKIYERSRELVEIVANREGLRSLAKHILAIANMEQDYSHHYETRVNDYYGDLEEGSLELCISLINKIN